MKKRDEYIWYEKYRPREINDFILSDSVKKEVDGYLKDKNFDHLIFHGKWGTGKSSLTQFLISKLDLECLSLNASSKDERGIAVIDEKIIPFAQRMSFATFKVVDLREAEKLTKDAQEALKEVIEEYHDNCKFIFTTNNISKLDGGIRSRCTDIYIEPEDKKQVAKRLWYIVHNENIEATKQDVMEIVELYFPDIRSCVKTLQRHSKSGKLDTSNILTKKDIEKIIDIIPSAFNQSIKKRVSVWKEARSIISNVSSDNIDYAFSFLFENIDTIIPDDKLADTLLTIAEYMFRSSSVIDKETMLSACILEIINDN